MDERRSDRSRGRHHRGLLLLIPAAVIIAKGAKHRRAMRESGWGQAGPGRRHGHGPGFHGREGTADERASFRLPPKIEWMLETWHTRAHEQPAATDAPVV
jgi:hypothetical protein